MEKPQTVIKPPSGLSLNLRELWQYRELFYFFTWRDIKVKYKQTYLGIAWALIQPLGLMLLFTLIFSKSLHINTYPIRYEIFVLSGLLLWNLFYSAVSSASESMLKNSNIIKKVFFPRLIIPSSSLLVALFDFLIAFIVFLIFCPLFGQALSWNALLVYPASLLLVLLAALGTGIFISALTIKYRDFRYIVPFLLQFLFFASQVVYSLGSINQTWLKYLLAINPVNGAIELFRSSFTNQFNAAIVLISTASALMITFIGLIYFRKSEAYFADLV
jgi:lipopolysaccharide transport system permease protein